MHQPLARETARDLWQREVDDCLHVGEVAPSLDQNGKFMLRILGFPTRMDAAIVRFLKSRADKVASGQLPRVPIAYGAKVFTDHFQ